MEAVITSGGNFPIERLSIDHDIGIPAVITIGEKRVSMLYYFEDLEDQNRDISLFLKANNARKAGNVYTIYGNSSQFGEYNFFGKLTEVPSLVFDYQYVSGGNHFFHLRFHEAYLDAFSSLIVSYALPGKNSVQYLGPNRGITENEKLFLESFRIKLVSFRFTFPDNSENIISSLNKYGDFAGEIRYINENKEIKFNTYFKDRNALLSDKNNKLSTENRIMEVAIKNEMLNDITFLSEHVAFPNFGIYFKRTNGILTFEALVPGLFCKEYIKKIFSIRKKLPQWNIVLDSVKDAF